jgi:NAD+ synthase
MNAFLKDEDLVIDEIVNFIKSEIENSKTNGAVIGLSGGIDSAVIAHLTSLAIGKENISLIHLPEKELDTIHTQDAQLTANQLDIPLRCIDISQLIIEMMDVYPELKKNPLAKGNLKARLRGLNLYTISNLENKLVIGTSNKSELLIGYGTKFGDLAADIWPIGDLYKTEVFRIAEKLNVDSKIIQKPPTAGLWANQTDEEEIGVSYEKLDLFLVGLENEVGEEELAKTIGLSKAQIERIKTLIEKNRHKSMMPKRLKVQR